MDKLSIQGLNAIFTCFDRHPSTILWIRSKDYQRQIYIGSNFEKIWKRPVDLIYNAPDTWNQFLYKEDKQQIIHEINNRIITPEQTGSRMLYRIVDVNGNIKYIIDEVFMIEDDRNEHVGFLGYSIILTEIEWHELKTEQQFNNHDHQKQMIRKDILKIVQNELKVGLSPALKNSKQLKICSISTEMSHKIMLEHDGKSISLTSREAECIRMLMAGKTAKETAAALKISPRTVLFHLDNLRHKTQSKSKLELLGKLIIKD